MLKKAFITAGAAMAGRSPSPENPPDQLPSILPSAARDETSGILPTSNRHLSGVSRRSSFFAVSPNRFDDEPIWGDTLSKEHSSSSGEEESDRKSWLERVAFCTAICSLVNGTFQYLSDRKQYEEKNQQLKYHTYHNHEINFGVTTTSALLSLGIINIPYKFLSIAFGPAVAFFNEYRQHERLGYSTFEAAVALDQSGILGLAVPCIPIVASENAKHELFSDHKVHYREFESTQRNFLEKMTSSQLNLRNAKTREDRLHALNELIVVSSEAEVHLRQLRNICTNSLNSVIAMSAESTVECEFTRRVKGSHEALLTSISMLEKEASELELKSINQTEKENEAYRRPIALSSRSKTVKGQAALKEINQVNQTENKGSLPSTTRRTYPSKHHYFQPAAEIDHNGRLLRTQDERSSSHVLKTPWH